MSLSNRMEEYYQKIIHLQEKLRQSEEERLKLEMNFNEMLQRMKEEEEVHFKKLRSKYKQFLEDDRRRQQRNDRILEALDRIESRTAMWEAKTQKFKAARKKYCDYLKQVGTHSQRSRSPFDMEFKFDQTDSAQDFKPMFASSHDGDSPNMPRSRRNRDDDTIEVMEKYLQSVSSDKCKSELLQRQSSSPKRNYSNLGNINSIYWKNPTTIEKADKQKEDEFDSTQLKTTKDIQNTLRQNSSVSIASNSKNYNYDDEKHQISNNFSFTNEISPSKLTFDNTSPKQSLHHVEADESLTVIKSKQQSLHDQQNISPIPTPDLTPNSPKISNDQKEETPLINDNCTSLSSTDLPQLKSCKSDLNIENQLSTVKLDDQSPSPLQLNECLNADPVNSVDDQNHGAVTIADYGPLSSPSVNDEYKPIENTQMNEDSSNKIDLDNVTRENIGEQLKTDNVSSVLTTEQGETDENPPEETNDIEKQKLMAPDNVSEQAGEQPIQQYNIDSQPQQQYDETGQYLQQYYDETSQLVPEYDENGQPVQQYDESGQSLQQYYDENEQLQMQYYDENGQPLQQYYENGEQQLQQYDENGQPIDQGLARYDENGQPIAQYDESGQPLQEYYDEHGQPVQYYAENAADPQYDPGNQPLPAQYDDQSYEAPQEHHQVQEQGEDQKPLEAKDNILDMLETDTESAKQDTKISNDSDFDFSNA